VLGLITGWMAYKAMAMIDEHAIEILITLGIVAGTYALAGRIEILGHHLSGPIAVVVAGLLIGNKGAEFAMSEKTRTYLFGFWEMIDEILNSVLFLLIGLEILILSDQLNPGTAIALILLAIPLVLFARLTAVTIPIKFLGIFKSFTKGAIPVLTWGGLRGGISVALALSLPNTVEAKPVILMATYGVVIFSIIVQGLTVKTVVQRTVDPELLHIFVGWISASSRVIHHAVEHLKVDYAKRLIHPTFFFCAPATPVPKQKAQARLEYRGLRNWRSGRQKFLR